MNTFFLDEFKYIGYLFLVIFIITLLIMLMAYLFSVNKPTKDKLSLYECGFNPYSDSRVNVDVYFYVICVLFVVFDMETIFFLSWVLSLNTLDLESYFLMVDFILELLIGFYYIYSVGLLEWKSL